MTFYVREGEKFRINIQHVIGDVQYPKNWFMDAYNRDNFGVSEGVSVPAPDHDSVLQYAEEMSLVLVDGKWKQQWKIVDKFKNAADEAAYIEQLDTAAAASARTERDSRLALTDFHGLTDNTMSAAMTTYRQALRDVPQQDEFPNEINWPTEPN